MPRNPDRSRAAGPDIVLGVALVVVAIVFDHKYGDTAPALTFAVWTAALAVLGRGVLVALWTRIVRTYDKYLA